MRYVDPRKQAQRNNGGPIGAPPAGGKKAGLRGVSARLALPIREIREVSKSVTDFLDFYSL